MKQIEYKTVKCKFEKILKYGVNYNNFYQIINVSNKLVILCYLFMRSYILNRYEINKQITLIDEKFIRDSIKTLTTSRGTGKKSQIDDDIKNFYNDIFIKNIKGTQKIQISNMTFTNTELVSEMLISIKQSIITNYDKCLNKYIWDYLNEFYKDNKNEDIKKEKKSSFTRIKDILFGNLKISLDDIHKKWIDNESKQLIPESLIKNGYEKDIKCNFSNYIKSMIYMNKSNEERKSKLIQFFPIRKSLYPKYVTFNTSSIIDIFIKKKAKYLKDTAKLATEIWKSSFDFGKIKLKGYTFANSICTDGYCASIKFINNRDVDKLNIKKKRMKDAREKAKIMKHKKSTDEKTKNKLENLRKLELNKRKRKDAFKNLPKEKQSEIILNKQVNETFPYIEVLVKKENYCDEIKEALKSKKIIVGDPGCANQLTLMGLKNDDELKQTNDSNYIRTHKRALKFKKFKFLHFSTKHRLIHTKRLKHNKKIHVRKCTIKINNKRIIDPSSLLSQTLGRTFFDFLRKSKKVEYEYELTKFNSKTCNLINFWKYINKKLEINNILSKEYSNTFYRKLKWYNYINTRRYDDYMINKIKKVYGDDIMIILGDWSKKNRLHFISTPNSRIKKKLAEHFKVIMIDEFNTSKIHYKYHIPCENMKCKISKKTRKEKKDELNELYEKEKNRDIYKKLDEYTIRESLKTKIKPYHDIPILKKIHSVLLFKTEYHVSGCILRRPSGSSNPSHKLFEFTTCINRDRNAVMNMWNIVETLVRSKERPPEFKRGYECNKTYKKGNIPKTLEELLS